MATETTTTTTPAGDAPRKSGQAGLLMVAVILVLGGALIWYSGVLRGEPRVALVTSGDGPYWDPVIAGAQAAARDHGVELRVERIASDPFLQADVLKRLSGSGLSGIAVSPLNASVQANLLSDVASGTTLVTMDSDSPVTGRLCFVGTDNYAAGRAAGAEVRRVLPDGGEVILCLGNPDKANTLHRRKGVIDELLDRPADPGTAAADPVRAPPDVDQPLAGERYTILTTLVDNSDPARATELAAQALADHPNVKCFVGLLGYSAPSVLAALERAGRQGQVKVIGFDIDERTLAGIEAGHVDATIMQDQYGCGYHAVRILAAHAKGVRGGLPLFQMHALPHRAIVRDNLHEARAAAAGGATTRPARAAAAPPATMPTS